MPLDESVFMSHTHPTVGTPIAAARAPRYWGRSANIVGGKFAAYSVQRIFFLYYPSDFSQWSWIKIFSYCFKNQSEIKQAHVKLFMVYSN